MKLTENMCLRTGRWMGLWLLGMAMACVASGQTVSTTTVQGTVYLANGQPGAGTLDVSWPAFTTANNQAVAAGRTTVTIAPDGFVSVNLAPNLGATPGGLYYTAVYQMSDGTTSTEYWVVPAAAQATLGQVRAQVMPAAQAVQAVSKAYVDQSLAELSQSELTASGGTLNGPLYLSGDPTQALQAADKHYVDTEVQTAVPLAGGNMTGPLAAPTVNGVQAPSPGSVQTTLQTAVNAAGTNGGMEIPPTYAGSDSFTNPNGVRVTDWRTGGAQQAARSVKEFGAVCDGATDDTAALQAALNYAQAHGVSLTIPQGTCKTHTLAWHGESLGGMGKQVSALMGYPGQDVLATAADSSSLLSYTHVHDLTIYVDQSVDVSCSAAQGRAAAGSCTLNRPVENNSIFSPGGSGLTGVAGQGAGWSVGNCAIAMPAATGAGGNGLRVAAIENVEIAATGADPMAQYAGAHSTHTCGMYLGQWPQGSEFRNIDIRGLNTGIALPALPGTAPAGLAADSNRWENLTIETTHGFAAAAGSNDVLDNVAVTAENSAATGETPTGVVLDLSGAQQGWTVRNAVVTPVWDAVQPQLTVTAAGGAVTAVAVGPEHGLGFDPYGTQAPVAFSGACTAQAAASVNSDGSIGGVTVTQGGTGCSATTTASVNVAGTWDTAGPVNLIGGQNAMLFGGNLLKGNGGYTVWNATNARSYGTQMAGGGGTLPGGGTYAGLVSNTAPGSSFAVEQFPGGDFGAKLQACVNALSATDGGTCDARDFTGTLSMGGKLTIATANAAVLLPCATIATANQVVVTAGTRNVSLRGCALRGTSGASGSQGGTVFLYSGTGAMVQVGDATYTADTPGFRMDNVAINTTQSASGTAQGLAAYRTQEMDLESVYFLGNQNQTGMTLDGTGNYTGGTFYDDQFTGFQTAVNAVGHQVANAATTDWLNASTFVRLHIDCPTSGGNPISGTYGINLQQGDGNTFTGGDVEGCDTALHLGANAQNNTIVGLRNENSNNQVLADADSAYNNWMTGGTMFTGKLTDNGTRNSFLDTFHRSFNGLNGDWYGSQKDATITNHYRLGIGAGNERGLLDRYQTDAGYRWTMGLSDATAGEQFYQIQDELNNVYRVSIGQYNLGQASTNNQTAINAAGSGAVVLNGSNNAGTGGVVIGSGGANETTVATISNAGNAQFNGTLQVNGTTTLGGTPTVKNQADAEVDATLWAGLTAPQKESFIYKDWNGNSQWYMVKDASNNWALNSAVGGLDSFKAYQSTNSGDTYVNASNTGGHIRLNYESGSGTETDIYSNGSLDAAFLGTTSIKLPGLAASSGQNCLQIDSSGYITNTGSACGTGGGSAGTGTINAGTTGQVAMYTTNGTTVGGASAVPLTAGGTGASTAATALANLGGIASSGGTMTGALNVSGDTPTGHQAASANAAVTAVSVLAYGAKGDVLPNTHNTFVQGSLTSGSNVLYVSSGSFTSADIGKYVVFSGWTSQPFSTTPSVAQITGVNDAQHVALSRTAASTTTGYIAWGTDNAPSFNAAAAAVAALGGGVVTVPAGSYLLATAPYYAVTGASDDGSYGTPAGGSGAVVTATVAGGAISGYSVTSGGSGYTPNAVLQISFSGGCSTVYTGPCGGAFATANTNSSGQVTSINPVYAGYGYALAPSIGVIPLGGDGAAATATISGGSINSVTVTNGGGGYAANSSVDVFGMGGAGCATLNYVGHGWTGYTAQGTAATNAAGQVTSVTMSNAGSGCTSAPALIFGDYACNTGTQASPVWGQCNNVAPLNPAALPVQVMMVPGVSWQGVSGGQAGSARLQSAWDGISVDNNEPSIFGGPIALEDIKGLAFNSGFVGILATNNVNYAHLSDLVFNTALGMWTAETDIGSIFENLSFNGYATWINGGTWTTRQDAPNEGGGFFDAEYVANLIARPASYGTVSPELDDWFNNNFWHAEFSANSTDFGETCKFPQAANQRQTSHSLVLPQQANFFCYRGISDLGMAILPRGDRLSGNAVMNNLIVKQVNRYIFYGDLGAMTVTNLSCEGCTPLTSDPYRNAAVQEGAVVFGDTGYSSSGGDHATLNGISYNAGTVNRNLWSITAQGDPVHTVWSNNAGSSGGQASENPGFSVAVNFPQGISLGNASTGAAPLNFYNWSSNAQHFSGAMVGQSSGIQVLGMDDATDVIDFSTGLIAAHQALSAPSVAIGGGTAMTGSVGNGGYAQQTTSAAKTSGHCVQFDANGNTVDAGAACNSGGGGGLAGGVPAWLQNLGDGSDGANTNASGSLSGDYYYTTFTVPYGNTVTASNLTIHATGTCTIAGTINSFSAGNNYLYGSSANAGGAGGGGGGGTSAGAGGYALKANPGWANMLYENGGAGGASSGGNGGNYVGMYGQPAGRNAVAFYGQYDGAFLWAGPGGRGYNNPASGQGASDSAQGLGITLICGQIAGTDGTHTGTIDASGQPANPSTGNGIGANGGAGGGVIVLSSQAAVATWPATWVAPGTGGLVTVPEAAAEGGSCTQEPKVTLGVTSGALSSCTVVQAGAGCGAAGAGVKFVVLGGGGTGGTVTPTWNSSGYLASCTASGGSGYTAAAYTTAGTGGDGAPGQVYKYQGW